MQKFTTCLMFVGEQHSKAEEAVNLYVSLFENSSVLGIERYGPDDQGMEGTIKQARFALNGQVFMAMDSGLEHAFTFTPAISLFVQCETEAEIENAYSRLAEGGMVAMPLDAYPFSPKFGWVQDRFGVSWQLNLAAS